MKYIDAEKLTAEIERRIDLICTTEGVVKRDRLQEYETLRDIEDFIDSLQRERPEVDLEKALDEYYKIVDWGPSEAIEYDTHKDIARHFYELGLNARKEE